MSLIIFLVVGLIAGALASYILGRQQDLLVNLLIGIIGAVVGGLLAGLLGLGAYNLIGEIIIATVGADHLHLGVAANSSEAPGCLDRRQGHNRDLGG